MKKFDLFKNSLLKYIILFFPVFLIIGNLVSNTIFLVIFLIYSIDCILNKKVLYLEKFEFKIFIAFYLYLIINSLLSSNTNISLIRSFFYLKYFIFIFVYLNFFEKNIISLKKIGYFWATILLILNLDIIFQSFTGKDIFGFDSGNPLRNSGFFFDELVAGSFLLAFSFISIFLINDEKKFNMYAIFFLLFCVITCFLTGERSNTIKIFLLSFLILIFLTRINVELLKKNFKIIILSSLFLMPLIIFNYNDLKIRYTNNISFSNNENLNLFNKYLTSAYGSHTLSAFYIFKDNPIKGVGNKNFRFECKKYDIKVSDFQKSIDPKKSKFPLGCSTHPHQIYNEFLSEHGILGSLLILFFIFTPIFRKLRFKNYSKLNLVSLFYIVLVFIPILPSGSFFTSYSSSLFWINYLFFLIKKNAK